MKYGYIEVTTKPRLLKQGNRWMCISLSKYRWFREQKLLCEYGATPRGAYYEWKFKAIDVGNFQ